MSLIQKNVKVPTETWARLRRNAQATGVPVCVFLTHLINQSTPVSIDDSDTFRKLQTIEDQRSRVGDGEPVRI
jgi:hypothetical protein